MKSSLVSFATIAAEGSESIPPIAFGIVTFVILLVLLLGILAFKNVGTRNRGK